MVVAFAIAFMLSPIAVMLIHGHARKGGLLELACQAYWWLLAGMYALGFIIGFLQMFDTETYHDEECFVGRSGLVCE